MSNPWDADIDISPEIARELIGRQFPVLGQFALEPFGAGWDNAAYIVDGRIVFRFPRRRFAVPFMRYEIGCLPYLAPALPLPVPCPTYVGVPEPRYPFPFAGYALLFGTTADRLTWTEGQRLAAAPALGGFLATLHHVPISKAMQDAVPGDQLDRADIRKRLPMTVERLRSVSTLLPDLDCDRLARLIERIADETPLHTGPACWVHGDLYARHLLADQDRRICGVIDWGDVHQGDPAVDLAIAWSFLPPPAHATFRAAYGAIDDACWERARFRAVHYGAILVLYGHDIGDRAIEGAGEYALRNVA